MDSGQQIETIFNNGARVILELNQELSELRVKFGDQSKLVQRKSDQLTTLITLHDNVKEHVSQLTDGLIMAQAVHHAKDVIIMQHETGLSWDKLSALMGWPDNELTRKATDTLTKIDLLLNELKQFPSNGE
jgi:hypothetical protein